MRLPLIVTALCGLAVVEAGEPAVPSRGTPYDAPWGDLKGELLWASSCELPEGKGLAFSGQSQIADDGCPHTRVKEGAAWKRIDEELRSRNPLQKQYAAAWELRTRLKNAATRARFIFFEGRPEADEKKFLNGEVNPLFAKLSADLAAFTKELEGLTGFGEYEIGQTKFALSHIQSAIPVIKPFVGRVTPDALAALRQAQQDLELGAEALGAEPPPRALSPPAYDAKTGLYVLFAGEHFDYVTNDTWVFDPTKQRWFQRHPDGAPYPRGDHKLIASGDGTVKASGGLIYSSKTDYRSNQYCSVGGGDWVYDIDKNAWSGPAGEAKLPADSRVYRTGPYLPEHFMKGTPPDAAANETRLNALPANTWVQMNVPQKLLLNRDWGTVALDPDRDMLIFWSGGHCVHSGSDVPHYHLSTNRWELHFPIEMPLGFIGASGCGVDGRNFNLRPWMSNHTWKSYCYDSGLKKLVVVGRNNQKEHDRYTYLYDPDLGDWTERFPAPAAMRISNFDAEPCSTPKGVLCWTADSTTLWMLDRATLKWSPLKFTGKLPRPGVDSAGLVYDGKRDRVLFAQTGWETAFSGLLYSLDMKTMEVTELSPEGKEGVSSIKSGGELRELVYDPMADLYLWGAWCPDKNHMPAYDPVKNRWLAAKIQGPAPLGYISGMAYDAKRKLIWLVQNCRASGEVFALRLDPKTAELQPLAEFAAEKK